MALESNFQRRVIEELEEKFPGSFIMKTDPGYIQGIPDLLILHGDTWAALEVKKDAAALKTSLKKNPNQEIYVERLNSMSYSAFIYPENKEDIFNDLERTFKPKRKALAF